MKFEYIDRNNWKREEYFRHYKENIPCTYSISAKLDISNIKNRNEKIYPAMLYAISTIVNRYEEFRTALDEDGRVGMFDEMMPCYTVFNKETEMFSNIWTEYRKDYSEFKRLYTEDMENYGNFTSMDAKPGTPINTFPVSMIPWISFEGFNLNLQKGYDYLLPIFTMGKYCIEDGKYIMPISVQVHHAVCDGFHVSRFINELQEFINKFEWI